ncbi:MAG TPA: CSLREA domain-containing protein [Xanthomonadales bacterium]|nr:CSLREA domain-containing protein [Xanthomonadales bacterium]
MFLPGRTLFFLLSIFLTAPAHASLIFVNTANDELNSDGDCSLREAVEFANSNAAVDGCTGGQSVQTDAIFFTVGDEIVLSPGLSPLIITDRVNLVGSGRETTIISQVSTIQLFLVNMADPTHDVEFSQMTLRNGHAVPGLYGGAVRLMDGDRFEFRDVAFIDNTTQRLAQPRKAGREGVQFSPAH